MSATCAAMWAHLAGELRQHAHRGPLQLAIWLSVAILARRKVNRGHVLVAVVDVIHAMRCGHHMLRPNQRTSALQTSALIAGPSQSNILLHAAKIKL